jgi:hypothetical protein
MQEASKARETRLRKAGIQGRARLASELRTMDNEVAAVSRALAVRTLQLEAEFVFAALEAEALDILVSLLLHLVHHLEQKQRRQYIIKLCIHALYLCREIQQPARQVVTEVWLWDVVALVMKLHCLLPSSNCWTSSLRLSCQRLNLAGLFSLTTCSSPGLLLTFRICALDLGLATPMYLVEQA